MAWPRTGATVCRAHGGLAPQVRAAAEQRAREDAARALAARHAIPLDVDPTGQILHLVRVSAGIAEWIWLLRLATTANPTLRARQPATNPFVQPAESARTNTGRWTSLASSPRR